MGVPWRRAGWAVGRNGRPWQRSIHSCGLLFLSRFMGGLICPEGLPELVEVRLGVLRAEGGRIPGQWRRKDPGVVAVAEAHLDSYQPGVISSRSWSRWIDRLAVRAVEVKFETLREQAMGQEAPRCG